jgi:hypothetical protein
MIFALFLSLAFAAVDLRKEFRTTDLFAGAGLQTYAHTVFSGIVEMNCTTNDDCYEVLCDYQFQPLYYVDIVPNNWNGNCARLPPDYRTLLAEFVTFTVNNSITSYSTSTVSGASVLLCFLNTNTSIVEIQYYGYSCA